MWGPTFLAVSLAGVAEQGKAEQWMSTLESIPEMSSLVGGALCPFKETLYSSLPLQTVSYPSSDMET